MTRGSHISLFSGVGMTDLAAEKAGFKTVATAEVDPFCRSVLQARFPDAVHLDDVKHVSSDRGDLGLLEWEKGGRKFGLKRPLLVSGGFPCQDISSPGTGLGLSGSRSGLWGEFARVIKDFRPEYVLIENSPLLRSRGLDVVLADLWRLGYKARWDCVPAGAVGAPHLRDRIFIVATPEQTPDYQGGSIHFGSLDPKRLPRAGHMRFGTVQPLTPSYPIKAVNALRRKLYPTPTKSDGSGGPGTTPKRTGGKNLRTVVAEKDGNGRLNPYWVEWMMGLPTGWTNPTEPNDVLTPHAGWHVVAGGHFREPWARTDERRTIQSRAQRIRALGNGLVPQAASVALGWMIDEDEEN